MMPVTPSAYHRAGVSGGRLAAAGSEGAMAGDSDTTLVADGDSHGHRAAMAAS